MKESALTRRLFGENPDTRDPRVRARCGTLSGGLGIVLNLLLFAAKLAAGLIAGSISIIADAVNNLSDAGSSIVTLAGFRISARRADSEHPFGHGRFEYLSGMGVAVLIILMGVELIQQSIEKILSPAETVFSILTAVILIASIAVKLFLYFFNRSLSRFLGSAALDSTAKDSRNDCIATAVVLGSLLIQQYTGLAVDGICGLAVAVFVVWSGISALIETVNPLLGEKPDPELVEQITNIVMKTPGVLGMHDLVIHDYGPGKRMMTLHVEVSSEKSLTAAHDLADGLEDRMLRLFGLQTVIHIDPVDLRNEETASLRESLKSYLLKEDPKILFHDFRIVQEEDGSRQVHFDLNLPYDYPRKDEEIQSEVSEYMLSLSPEIQPVIHIDHYEV